MLKNIEWLFFDVGSTIVDERLAYEHRFKDIAHLADRSYGDVYETALEFYMENKKGDLEAAKHFGVPVPQWHTEDEVLYADAARCLETLSRKYKIGIIANQAPGTEKRLQ